MAGLSLQFRPGAAKRRQEEVRRQREKEASELRFELLDRGLTPQEVNPLVSEFVNTGSYDLPTERVRNEPPKIGIGPENQVRDPITDLRKQSLMYPFDPETGTYGSPIAAPKGSRVNVTRPPQADVPIFQYDPETGELVQVGTGPKQSKVVKKTTPGTSETPQQKAARQTITDYQRALAKGTASQEQAEAAASAAEFLGLSVERPVTEKKSFLKKVQNAASIATGGKVPPAEKEFQEGAPVIKFEPGGGADKPLTPEIAGQYLQKYGDRKRAEEAARRDGYRF